MICFHASDVCLGPGLGVRLPYSFYLLVLSFCMIHNVHILLYISLGPEFTLTDHQTQGKFPLACLLVFFKELQGNTKKFDFFLKP